MKRSTKQNRKASATELEKYLPAKNGKSGETVIPDRVIRRTIKRLSK